MAIDGYYQTGFFRIYEILYMYSLIKFHENREKKNLDRSDNI
jgi:hypothetical protein